MINPKSQIKINPQIPMNETGSLEFVNLVSGIYLELVF